MKLSKQFNSFHVFSSFFLSPKLSCFLNFVELTRWENYVFEMELKSQKKIIIFQVRMWISAFVIGRIFDRIARTCYRR